MDKNLKFAILLLVFSQVNCFLDQIKFDNNCQVIYNEKMVNLHNMNRIMKHQYPLEIDHSMAKNAFQVIDAKIRNNKPFFQTNPFFWNIFREKLTDNTISCEGLAIEDFNEQLKEMNYINSDKMRYMSCALRIENKFTTTACVYTEEPKTLRTYVQRDPLYPYWRSTFKELGEKDWVQLEDGRVIGYWSVVEENIQSRNVVILKRSRMNNKEWMNSKLTYVLTPLKQYIKNRINKEGEYENISLKGFWD